jgi:hypothetical protein
MGPTQKKEGKSPCQIFGGTFPRPWLARELARIALARGRLAGQANYLVRSKLLPNFTG